MHTDECTYISHNLLRQSTLARSYVHTHAHTHTRTEEQFNILQASSPCGVMQSGLA